jgi:hypothetical protein
MHKSQSLAALLTIISILRTIEVVQAPLILYPHPNIGRPVKLLLVLANTYILDFRLLEISDQNFCTPIRHVRVLEVGLPLRRGEGSVSLYITRSV